MIADRSIYRTAHLCLEALSAHGIQSGRGDSTHDVLLVRDVNGLPALPGSSLAGVLRSAFRVRYGTDETNRLFGNIGKEACISAVSVGWGYVHDGKNQVIEGLRADDINDDLLEFLRRDKPIVRQRVRLNHRGSSPDGGKFDTTWIPAGVRYTTRLGYWCDGSQSSKKLWSNLIDLIRSEDLRLGHGTRSGAGQFKVSAFSSHSWDLTTPEGKSGFISRDRSRNTILSEPVSVVDSESLRVSLKLKAESGWRIGGGEVSLESRGPDEKTPDLLPQHELFVAWHNDKAVLSKQNHLLPGSAIKGALRHRVAFHYRCLNKQFSHTIAPDQYEADECPAIVSLFGNSSGDQGSAGLLTFEDILIDDGQLQTLMHNRIDRFTGGVIDGALFSEEVLWQTAIEIRIRLQSGPKLDGVDTSTRKALSMALEDLQRGWLPIGAGGSRGLGVFTGSENAAVWSDGGKWIGNVEFKEVA